MLFRYTFCFFIALTLRSPAIRAQSLVAQQALDSLRSRYQLPALLAAVIEPGRIRYVYGGVRRSDQPAPVQLTDYFHLGSNTKGITSLLAGKLVGRTGSPQLRRAAAALRAGLSWPNRRPAALGTLATATGR